MPQPIRKVVFPVAGLGTRFLPATKAVPKEMLPVVDRPLIQWAVEEATAAGCTEFIFVSAPEKKAIINHFSDAPHYESVLQARGKTAELELLKAGLPQGATIIELFRKPRSALVMPFGAPMRQWVTSHSPSYCPMIWCCMAKAV